MPFSFITFCICIYEAFTHNSHCDCAHIQSMLMLLLWLFLPMIVLYLLLCMCVCVISVHLFHLVWLLRNDINVVMQCAFIGRFKAILIAKIDPSDVWPMLLKINTLIRRRTGHRMNENEKGLTNSSHRWACSIVTLIYLYGYFVGIKPIRRLFPHFSLSCCLFLILANMRATTQISCKPTRVCQKIQNTRTLSVWPMLSIHSNKCLHSIDNTCNTHSYTIFIRSSLINNTTLSFTVIEYTKLCTRHNGWEWHRWHREKTK